MGLQKLQIRGFRSLKDLTWEPGKLNVVIGPNGSGKSNLLRAIALLQQSATGELPNAVLRQGGIAPLLWDGAVTEMSWKIKTDPVTPGRDSARNALTYELVLRRLGETSAYRVEQERLANYYRVEAGQAAEPFKFLERDPRHAVVFDQQEHALAAHEGSVPDDQMLLSLFGGPFGNPVVLSFRDHLASWAVYHDVHVDQQAPIRQATVARLEKRVAPDGQNLIRVMHTLYSGDREFKKSLDAAMRAAFGTDFEELVFPPAADQQIQLRLRWKTLRREQSALDLSDGTIRFLLLFAILASPNTGDLIAIDEPEAGLHPAMLPIIAELAVDAARRAQIILTTHSPEFLDAFSQEPPTTTVAQWTDGESHLSIIDGEELRRWLRKYRLGAMLRSGELEALAK
jgi:predicted ATPase